MKDDKSHWLVALKVQLFEFLKGQAKKLALKQIFGRVIGGIRGWTIGIVVDVVFKKAVKPFFDWIVRRLRYAGDVRKGKKQYDKVEQAKKKPDQDIYDDAVDDIFK